MRISALANRTIQFYKCKQPLINKKVYRIAMNALIIGNCCLVTSLFFVASKAILSVALIVSIIGSSILIDRCYKRMLI